MSSTKWVKIWFKSAVRLVKASLKPQISKPKATVKKKTWEKSG